MLTFRPHHFMCTLGFSGKGYSSDFVKNYASIVRVLQRDEGILIKVTSGTDSICAACPEKLTHNLCIDQKTVAPLDEAHSQILGIKDGDVFTWKHAKKLLVHKMTLKKFHQACKNCSWKKLGVCEAALKNLKAKSPN